MAIKDLTPIFSSSRPRPAGRSTGGTDVVITQPISLSAAAEVSIYTQMPHNIPGDYITYELNVDSAVRAMAIVQMPPSDVQWTAGSVGWGGSLAAGNHTIILQARGGLGGG